MLEGAGHQALVTGRKDWDSAVISEHVALHESSNGAALIGNGSPTTQAFYSISTQ